MHMFTYTLEYFSCDTGRRCDPLIRYDPLII